MTLEKESRPPENEKFLSRPLVLFALLSAYCSAMLIARMAHTERLTYIFLGWNLILAWVPLVFATLARHIHQQTRSFAGSFIALVPWLLFLPNAPYIVTDLIHLRPRPGMPYWFDILLLASFAFTGLMLGFASLKIVHQILKERFRPSYAWYMTAVITGMCSYGIYLGRVLRWNSWDVLRDPVQIANDLVQPFLHPFAHKETLLMTAAFAGFLFLGYLVFQGIQRGLENHK